jgi:hypothetical protein
MIMIAKPPYPVLSDFAIAKLIELDFKADLERKGNSGLVIFLHVY